ncbi:hypothetical protein QJS04_geneDACA016487 [Acorus gramineus]|uniref:Uncharacterized protein n=1 Tax=Acorus gramineus TaxID=55184 RepID=A0AAV9BBQ2_ACOGR|nr:hypothetical protein QJS04_geneDACA016487 [Acorus gramineus]
MAASSVFAVAVRTEGGKTQQGSRCGKQHLSGASASVGEEFVMISIIITTTTAKTLAMEREVLLMTNSSPAQAQSPRWCCFPQRQPCCRLPPSVESEATVPTTAPTRALPTDDRRSDRCV